MGKIDKKYMQGRIEGMEFALKVAKEQGVEGLEAECRRRNKSEVSFNLTADEEEMMWNAIRQHYGKHIMESCFDVVSLLSVVALHDQFGFGETRILRFLDSVQKANEYLDMGYTTIDDYLASIKEQMKFDIIINWYKGNPKSLPVIDHWIHDNDIPEGFEALLLTKDGDMVVGTCYADGIEVKQIEPEYSDIRAWIPTPARK